MSRKFIKKKWVSFTFRIAVTLLLFVFLFKSISWSTLLAAIVHANHLFILLGLLIGIVACAVSAYQWQILLRAEHIHVGFLRLLKLYLIGIGFSHFLPTGMGGDVVKAFYVGGESGNYAGSASAIVVTRLTGFFGMLLIAFTALIIGHAYFNQSIIVSAILLSLLVGGLIGGVILLATLLPRILKRTWMRHRIIASAIPIANALIKTIQRPRLLAHVTAIGIVFWLLSILDYYSYATALSMQVPLYFYFVAIPIVSLVAFLPITINGFGLRESAFVYIFSMVRVPAAPLATSLLLALMMDVQVFFFGVIGGCLYLTMKSEDRIIKQRRPENNVGTRFSASRENSASREIIASSIGGSRANVAWFTKEDQYVFDAETLIFDDSTPTLPMMLLSATRGDAIYRDQGEQAAPALPVPSHVQRPQRLPSSHTPVLQDIHPKAAFGKNRRVILIKDP